jgi:hypothetical protein
MPKFYYVYAAEAATLNDARSEATGWRPIAGELSAVVDAARVPKVVLAALNSMNDPVKGRRSLPVDG